MSIIGATPDINLTLSWALHDASRGLAVFPVQFVREDGGCSCGDATCGTIGKHPMTHDGFLSATTDPERVQYFFLGELDANIGIRTGAASGIVVVDIDPRHGGQDSFDEFVAKHGLLPATPMVKTGSGGLHNYFRHPGGHVGNRQNMLPGIDVRGDGGYVLAPWSNHLDGDYDFIPGHAFADLPFVDMPPALLDLVLGATPPSAGSSGEPSILDGQRNTTLFGLAASMRARGAGRESITAALTSENQVRCTPPLPDGAIAKIVASAMKYPAGTPPKARFDSALLREEVVRKTILAFEAANDQKLVEEKVNWVVSDFVAEGGITLITGKPKLSGKSTFVSYMVARIMDGRDFLGSTTKKSPVVILTEERTTFVELLRRAGTHGRPDLKFLRYDPSREASFAEQMAAAMEVAKEMGAKVLVVDTLAQFAGWRGDGENDTGSALESLRPLQDAAKAGLAVIVVHHEKKSGGGVGDSSRGNTALAGGVDAILSIQRPEGQGSPNVRVINTACRYPSIPSTLYVELTPSGYERREGTAVISAEVEKVLLDSAPTGETNAAQLKDIIAGADIKEATARKVAGELMKDGKLRRKGEGKKGNPHLFWKPNPIPFRTTPSPRSAEMNPGTCTQTGTSLVVISPPAGAP